MIISTIATEASTVRNTIAMNRSDSLKCFDVMGIDFSVEYSQFLSIHRGRVFMEAGLFTLGGVILGSLLTYFLSRSSERDRWLRDCRKQEFKELMADLANCTVEAFRLKHARIRDANTLPELQARVKEAQSRAHKTIIDRVYIAKEVKAMKLGNRFAGIMKDVHLTMEPDENKDASARIGALLEEIVAIAEKD